MTNTSYVALSKQAGLSKELNSIANNIANADTAGYRREGFVFSEYVRMLEPHERSVSQTNIGGRFFDAAPGALVETGSAYDVAIEGEGYFVVQTPNGERLTRAGAFVMDREGQLTTQEGHLVLGEGSSPIALPPNATNITIANDGSIAADGAPVGRMALVSAEPTELMREGGNLLRSTGELTPLEQPKLRQGFVEESNVNPVMEISRLIEVQRAYEMGQKLLKDDDERISKTVEAMRAR
ncbi:flagellar hook-basal body complex protein [Hyphococcus flavus]|uniref:Flagellar basal-body rod protein FlgF n=1 Tax=Hyphococcus flavus TaxID=1866326 RepID=A0AAF0CEM4_9PROT|nr:flagellar hook-basal body complex protein [Hyphococcus flavus]WDI31541.1 flagellar hook-basal body complex protein [Hyphococcus flavus]